MINVRLRLFHHGREFWSSPIRNKAALDELTVSLSRGGIQHSVYDDFGHANIADCCLAVANKLGGCDSPTPMIWGSKRQFCCLVAPLPAALGKLSWEGIHGGSTHVPADPRELSGPLPEEVAQHTPCACCEADASPAMVTVQPMLAPPTWWDRIMQALTGSRRGEAVRGQ